MGTFGFVRRCFDREEMKGVQQLPRFIIELIAKWVEMEYIHLMQAWMYQIGHWKLSISDMLKFGMFGWHILSAPTFHLYNDETIIAINDHEFIAKDAQQWQRLAKFNTLNNAWTSISMSMPENVVSWRPIAFDEKEKLLYMLARDKLMTFNPSTETTSIYDLSWAKYAKGNRILLIGDKLHVVAQNPVHYIFDKRSINLNQGLCQPDRNLEECSSIIFSESRKSIIAMDGTADPDKRFAEYSLATQQWEMLQWPGSPVMGLEDTGMACSEGRYLITFGGYVFNSVSGPSRFEKTDLIIVYDLNDRTSAPTRSAVRCPVTGDFHVLKMTNKKEEGMATFGYIRGCYGKEEFNGALFPPHYIIEMMAKWVEMEYVYLIEKCNNGGHWKRSMKDILQSHI